MEERKHTLARRIAGVVMFLSSLFIAIYGICIGRWDALIYAAVWYFVVGMLVMQQIDDVTALWRDELGKGAGEDVSESEYNKLS